MPSRDRAARAARESARERAHERKDTTMLETLVRDWGGPLAFGVFLTIGWWPFAWVACKLMGWC